MAARTPSAEERLARASHAFVDALVDRTIGAADRKVTGLTDKMTDLASNGGLPLPHVGAPPVKQVGTAVGSTVAGALGTAKDKAQELAPHPSLPDLHLPHPDLHLPHPSVPRLPRPRLPRPHLFQQRRRGSGGGDETKVTTIIEEIDVGLPVSFVYDQWTEFGSFPSFMKKVENVDAVEDERLRWKAQIWWSHREWEATILEQLPDERIVWRSEGKKGHVDGAVTFHELTPDLTRIIVVLEYHPQGLFEHTANLWRAQGRRVRAELQHFRRHVMAHAVLEPDEVRGWRGVIEDGEVVEDDDEYRERTGDAGPDQDEPEDQAEDYDEDEGEGDAEPEDEAEDEAEDYEDDEDTDEGDGEPEPDEEEERA